MTIFDQKLEQIQDRLDRAIQVNIEKYPECQFDFTNTEPSKRAAMTKLSNAVADCAENKITEQEVKPHFINWINTIKNAQSAA